MAFSFYPSDFLLNSFGEFLISPLKFNPQIFFLISNQTCEFLFGDVGNGTIAIIKFHLIRTVPVGRLAVPRYIFRWRDNNDNVEERVLTECQRA